MKIDLNRIMSISKVNQNFSEAAKAADEFGSIVIMKNNNPKYVIMTIEEYKSLNHSTELAKTDAER